MLSAYKMLRRTRIVFLLFGFCYLSLSAQDFDRDTSYIEIPDRPWSVRLHQVNKFSTISFQSSLDTVPAARFKTNEGPGIGAAVFRRSLGLWLALSLPADPEEESIKGPRQNFDFHINQYGKKFGIDAYLQYFKGFYLQNTKAFRAPIDGEPYIKRPDLQSLSFGLNVYRVFNWKKFSIRSAFIQSEIQKKSAGSFILGAGYSRHSFEADSAILPSNSRAPSLEESYVKGWFHAGLVSPGYAHTFVYKKHWYLNLSATIGVGGVYRSYTLENDQESRSIRGMLRFQGRAAAGYNSATVFAGVSSVFDRYDLTLSKADLKYRWGIVRVFLGYRPDW